MDPAHFHAALTPQLILPIGEATEPLNEIGVSLNDCGRLLCRLYHNAIADKGQAVLHLTPVLEAVSRRRTVGSVLANRIYPPTTPQELEALTRG